MKTMSVPSFLPALRILRVGWMLALGLVTISIDVRVNGPGHSFRAHDAHADTSLPPLTVCAAAEWVITNPTPDSVVYQCHSVCPAQDGSECVYAAPKRRIEYFAFASGRCAANAASSPSGPPGRLREYAA